MRTWIILAIIATVVAVGTYKVSQAVDNYVRPQLQMMGLIESG